MAKLVKGLGKECARMFKKIVSVKNTKNLTQEEAKTLCRTYPFHSLMNMHTHCDNNCPDRPDKAQFKMKKKEDRVKRAKIVIYFYLVSLTIENYQFKRATQKLESNHRIMLTLAPKIIDFKGSYSGRIDQAIAIINDGRSVFVKTMEAAGNVCNQMILDDVMEEDKRRKKQIAKNYKTQRPKWSANITQMHAVKHNFMYKGSDGLTKQQQNIIKKRDLENDADEEVQSEEPPKKNKSRSIHTMINVKVDHA